MTDPRRIARLGGCLLLVALTSLAFYPALDNGFVGLDDERYVTGNPAIQRGVDAESLGWALTAFHAANWHPLTWISHMLDWSLFGAEARGHHLVSGLIHLANVLLLFLLFSRMTGKLLPCLLMSLLFAIHPLRVESVAWVAERKDLLCALFWLLTLVAYTRWVERPGALRYGWVVLGSVAALASKPMAVGLPLTLLLLDYWPLRRLEQGPGAWIRLRRRFVEKLPLFALAAASAVVTVTAQRASGAVVDLALLPLPLRLANAVVAYAGYLGKTLWPARLAIPYPLSTDGVSTFKLLLSLLLLAAISEYVRRRFRQRPFLAFGWLWYLLTLLPVIGVVQVGSQAMADRYTYMPSIGLLAMLCFSLPRTVTDEEAVGDNAPARESIALALLFLVTPLLIATTWSQLGHWKDSRTLAARALLVTRENSGAHNLMGWSLAEQGQPGAALPHLLQAVKIRPGFSEAHNNLARAFADTGNLDLAIEHYRKAIALRPVYPEATLNLGVALARKGQTAAAIEAFERALEQRPGYGKAHANLAAARLSRGEIEEARRQVDLAVANDFQPPPALMRSLDELSRRE